MRIISEKPLKDFIAENPRSRIAIAEWIRIVRASQWTCFADVKATFNSVDNVGNNRFVFNISGNHYRIIVIIRFTPKMVYVRFVGTHDQYDKIKNISNI